MFHVSRKKRWASCGGNLNAKGKAAQESEKNSEDSRPLRISLRRKTETFPAQTFFLSSSPKCLHQTKTGADGNQAESAEADGF